MVLSLCPKVWHLMGVPKNSFVLFSIFAVVSPQIPDQLGPRHGQHLVWRRWKWLQAIGSDWSSQKCHQPVSVFGRNQPRVLMGQREACQERPVGRQLQRRSLVTNMVVPHNDWTLRCNFHLKISRNVFSAVFIFPNVHQFCVRVKKVSWCHSAVTNPAKNDTNRSQSLGEINHGFSWDVRPARSGQSVDKYKDVALWQTWTYHTIIEF